MLGPQQPWSHGWALSLQLIGKDIEESIEEEASGDLKKAYLTIGKVK